MFAKPSDIHNDLLSTYFEHVHPYLPIIHRPTFQKQLQENKICELLLYAMYAVASRWNNNNNKHFNRMSKNNMQQPAGWTYYESAFKLLDNYADAPRVSTVQALILMIKYHEHVRRPGFFWRTRFYFQLIVRMCQDLELNRRHNHYYYHHRNSTTSVSNDQSRTVDTEQCSRLFWAVYVYDVLTR
ncbi:transcription factor domain-containing protein [Phascolomyces articulosus]|uniref:Transcription factor domain-containing protein n=1 Tax=Phascolomyces articulosus TaxID=60185 RepID=A0AAD5K9U4_9FUNG|nr:transcription factor domain-containing protein [Phascolomyces articulosus]